MEAFFASAGDEMACKEFVAWEGRTTLEEVALAQAHDEALSAGYEWTTRTTAPERADDL